MERKRLPLRHTQIQGKSVGSISVKVLTNIILMRLSSFYKNQLMTQFDFRSVEGCNDSICPPATSRECLTSLIGNCIESIMNLEQPTSIDIYFPLPLESALQTPNPLNASI